MLNHVDNITFKNKYRKFRSSMAIASNFEVLLVSDGDKKRHMPLSAAFVVDCEQVVSFQLYRGIDCLDKFVKGLKLVINEFAMKRQQFRIASMTQEGLEYS